MDKVNDFDIWFASYPESFPYTNAVRDTIKKRRTAFGGQLYFDLLLSLFDIHGGSYYPPKDMNQLRELFKHIVTSELDTLKKHCMILYLLKDWDNDAAQQFESTALVPLQYRKGIHGYWLLDHNRAEESIFFLTDPSVTPDFSEKIIFDLANVTSPQTALDFFDLSGAKITSMDFAKVYIRILSSVSIIDAFYFSRKYSLKNDIGDLLVEIFDYCFKDDKKSLEQLILMPFNENEEKKLIRYCEKNGTLPLCFDFLVVYYIQTGRYEDAIRTSDEMKSTTQTGGLSSTINRNVVIESLRSLIPGGVNINNYNLHEDE